MNKFANRTQAGRALAQELLASVHPASVHPTRVHLAREHQTGADDQTVVQAPPRGSAPVRRP